jgi:hypothetical protein
MVHSIAANGSSLVIRHSSSLSICTSEGFSCNEDEAWDDAWDEAEDDAEDDAWDDADDEAGESANLV